MNRSITTVVLFVLLLGSIGKVEGQPDEARLPNFIHIFADDLGYGDLGCFGATDIQTPNIDRMADEGMKFTEFYSASSVCSPSRAALLTGRMPQRMGINGVFFPASFTGMPPEDSSRSVMGPRCRSRHRLSLTPVSPQTIRTPTSPTISTASFRGTSFGT